MARLSRAQLEAKVDRLTDDLATANEKVETRDRTIRELNATNSSLVTDNEGLVRANARLTGERDTARNERDQVLLLVESAITCLSPAFGDMKFGETVRQGGRVFVVLNTVDNLAVVTLDPSDRSLTLVDPDDNVDSITVDIDKDGKLSRRELRDIRAFRGEVLLARQVSSGRGLDELDLLGGSSNGVVAGLVTKS